MFQLTVATALAAGLAAPLPSSAQPYEAVVPVKVQSLKECGELYRAAKSAGALGERSWAEFRKAECSDVPASRQANPATIRSEAARAEALRRLAFPNQLASEFHAEKPWKARMRTCLKSYRENKQAGTLYGIRWVEKGGGYYSLCAARLKTSA